MTTKRYKVYESNVFQFWRLNVGSTAIRKVDNRSVYFQPGDDTTEIMEQIEAIESEVAPKKRNMIFDMIIGEYFE